MDIQRLRNLATGRLHTDIAYVYEDIEYITGEKGVMTHQLPAAVRCLEPYLRKYATDPRFWDGKYDPEHTGNVDVPAMSADDKEKFFAGTLK